MGKLPYIPLYIGDWEQDTNTISLEAEGALLKLTFKLWKSFDKGLINFSLSQLSILFKKSEENTLKIITELQINKVLEVEFLSENEIKISSRRMLKEAQLSKVRGSTGGGRKSSNNNQTKIKKESKANQNTEYEVEYESENEVDKKGKKGAGKKGKSISIKEFIPPSEQQAIDYAIENGFSESLGRRAFKFYNENNWLDSNDNQIKNWKSKFQSVWFKEENKTSNIAAPKSKIENIMKVNLDHIAAESLLQKQNFDNVRLKNQE